MQVPTEPRRKVRAGPGPSDQDRTDPSSKTSHAARGGAATNVLHVGEATFSPSPFAASAILSS